MRILVLHSDVPPDAPADELDTLIAARAIADALQDRGHQPALSSFVFDFDRTRAAIAEHRPDVVFNMVEAVFRHGELALIAPAMLEKLNVTYTGSGATALATAGDKPLAKQFMRLAGLPTPDWDEAPFARLGRDNRYVVKSATEDASLGLDESCVVRGPEAVRTQAASLRRTHGGRWFAEEYIHGREFNVSILEDQEQPRVLPIPEMIFEGWAPERPRIVGYDAKWDDDSPDSVGTVRRFGGENEDPALYARLTELSQAAWRLFGLRGFARVDFRVGNNGEPVILEINPNPCLEESAGFAAAAGQAGMSYPDIIERIVLAARTTTHGDPIRGASQ